MLGLCAVSASLVLPPPASKQEAGLVAAPLNKITVKILGHLTFAVRAAALLLFRTCLVFSFSNLRVFLRVFQVAPIFSVEACFEENDPKNGPITAFRNKDDFPSQQARESPCFTLTTCDNFLLTRYVRRYETTRPEMRLSVVREARQRVAPSLPRYVCCNESWLCAM